MRKRKAKCVMLKIASWYPLWPIPVEATMPCGVEVSFSLAIMSGWACVRGEDTEGVRRKRVDWERSLRILLKVTVGTFHFTAHFHFILFPPTPTHTYIYSDLFNYSAVSYRAFHFDYWLIKKQQNSGLDGIISNCCCCHCFCFCCFNCCLLLAKIHGKKSRSNSQKEKKTKKTKKQRRAEKT